MLRSTVTIAIEERLQEVLREHWKYMRNVIAQHCPIDSGIEMRDIETDVQLCIWRALESERANTITSFYLFRVVATATIDAIRRVKARREEQRRLAEEVEDETTHPIPLDSKTVSGNQAQRSEIGRIIQVTLQRFPEDRRRAVGLFLQGYKIQEIAFAFGWTERQARNLTNRGLKTLRARLRAEGVACDLE